MRLATHYKLKIIQFVSKGEQEFLRILMKEGARVPQKFYFVPLYLQFDYGTKLEHVKSFANNVISCQSKNLFQKGVTIHIEENTNQNEDEFFRLVMTTLEVNKLSIINESQSGNKLTFTPGMNVKSISEFMCWDEDESLNRIRNIQLLQNLELVYFNKTAEFRLKDFPFSSFKNL